MIIVTSNWLLNNEKHYFMACVRPSELEAWVQVYREDKMAAYGGDGNLSSLVF